MGTLGGAAAVAGALGPTIGGALTTVSWRLVLLVNLPLAVVCLWATVSAVPRDRPPEGRVRVDLIGAGLLCFSIVALVFGFNETQSEGLTSLEVLGPVALAVLSGVGFVWWERRSPDPLMDIGLLRRTPNYLGATISQALGGFVEMGLGLIFPLLLILDLGMSPFVAGLALIPTTVPIVLFSTTIGRWYDRSGGRPPLVIGFGVLGLSGLALGIGVHLLQPAAPNYFFLLPGLLLFGTGLAFVLTACDPVSLDSVDQDLAGQVSGVSATAEQGGGAIGIAGLYAIFHQVYVRRLAHLTHSGSPHGLTPHQSEQLRQALQAAEQTGLQPNHFDQSLVRFLVPAFEASKLGYAAVFFSVIAVSAVGSVAAWRLVRKPAGRPSTSAGNNPLVGRTVWVAGWVRSDCQVAKRPRHEDYPGDSHHESQLCEDLAGKRKQVRVAAERDNRSERAERKANRHHPNHKTLPTTSRGRPQEYRRLSHLIRSEGSA